MTRRSGLTRFLIVLLATVQVAWPGVSAIADGRMSVPAADQYGHVEESSTETCSVAHAPHCALCRYLSAGHGAPVAPGRLMLASGIAKPTTAREVGRREGILRLSSARAPPAV